MRYIDLDELIKKKQSGWGNPPDLWTDKVLKNDFREYFHSKCWYCECYLGGSDMPIDHFRPKNKVKKYKDFDYNDSIANVGYYWLRNEPRNYRGSCTYSNSLRGNGGKGCYFPLEKGSAHLPINNTNTDIEKPVLLDPCVKDDVKLLSFLGATPVCTTKDTDDKKRVDASVALYNLNDTGITNGRIWLWKQVIKTIGYYEENKISRDACIDYLKEYTDRKQPFSSVAIAAVVSWDNEDIKGQLDLNL